MKNDLIANYLKGLRKEKGITQSELAKEMGVTFQAVSRWEKADSIPDLDTLSNLADYYKVSIDDILQRKMEIDNENQDFTIPSFILSTVVFIASLIILFIGKGISHNSIVISIAYGISSLSIIGGILLQNLTYFYITKRDSFTKKWYLLTFIPITITILLFVLISNGVID